MKTMKKKQKPKEVTTKVTEARLSWCKDDSLEWKCFTFELHSGIGTSGLEDLDCRFGR